MASRFAAWLRVTPSPATIAESSAILKQLKTQGRVTTFIKKQQDGDDENGASFYTIFSHEPPSLRTKFQVPVYHNLPRPQDEDPFNIRGLQTRKPLPEPKTFHCRLETVKQEDMDKQRQWITQQNSYHGSFKIDRTAMSAELRTVYAETGAPPGVAEGLRNFQDQPGRDVDESVVERPPKQRRLKMHSLVETWAEAKDSPSSFRRTRLQRSA